MSLRTTFKLVAGIVVAAAAGITAWGQSAVELKVLIEQMREQIQNIE